MALLKELKGSFELEGIDVSREQLQAIKRDYEIAKQRGEVSALIERVGSLSLDELKSRDPRHD